MTDLRNSHGYEQEDTNALHPSPQRPRHPLPSNSKTGSPAQQPSTSQGTSHDSVVPNLMRVYENMVGCNNNNNETPSIVINASSANVPAISWSITRNLPPVPGSVQEAMQLAAAATASGFHAPAAATSSPGVEEQQQPQQQQPPLPDEDEELETNTTTSSAASTTRVLRKRSSASPQYVTAPGGGGGNASASEDNNSQTNNNNGSDETWSRSSKSRRKTSKDNNDGRWSKRFTWPEPLHRDFVSAIFDVGLKHSSPSTILEHMPQHEQITTERIKSHLQKYRLNRTKSKKEFMTCYDASLAQLNKDGGKVQKNALSGGEIASHLTYEAIHPGTCLQQDDTGADQDHASDAQTQEPPAKRRLSALPKPGQQAAHITHQSQLPEDTILVPRLTDEEKKSPIGASMGYLMGLFFTLKQQLELQRQEQQQQQVAEAAALAAAEKTKGLSSLSFDAAATGASAVVSGGNSVSAAPTAAGAAAPSTRINLEENNMMKREMQYQMAFQNKMRLLKQQEEQKLSNSTTTTAGGTTGVIPLAPTHILRNNPGVNVVDPLVGATGMEHVADRHAEHGVAAAIEHEFKSEPDYMHHHHHHQPQQQQPPPQQQQHQQGPGDDGDRQRAISFGGNEDFWYTDVVDDQLFEFLMNN